MFYIKDFEKEINQINKILTKYNISIYKLAIITNISRRTLERILNKKIDKTFIDINLILIKLKEYINKSLINIIDYFEYNKLTNFNNINFYQNKISKNYYITRYIKSIVFSLTLFEEIDEYNDFFNNVLLIYDKNINYFKSSLNILSKNKIIILTENKIKRGKNFKYCKLNNKENTILLNSIIDYYEKKDEFLIVLKLLFLNKKNSFIKREGIFAKIITDYYIDGKFYKIFILFDN